MDMGCGAYYLLTYYLFTYQSVKKWSSPILCKENNLGYVSNTKHYTLCL